MSGRRLMAIRICTGSCVDAQCARRLGVMNRAPKRRGCQPSIFFLGCFRGINTHTHAAGLPGQLRTAQACRPDDEECPRAQLTHDGGGGGVTGAAGNDRSSSSTSRPLTPPSKSSSTACLSLAHPRGWSSSEPARWGSALPRALQRLPPRGRLRGIERHWPPAVCRAWPATPACALASGRVPRSEFCARLRRPAAAPAFAVHLRLGDVLDWPIYRPLSSAYTRPVAYYDRLPLPHPVVTLYGDAHYRERFGAARSLAYRDAVVRALAARGATVRARLVAPPATGRAPTRLRGPRLRDQRLAVLRSVRGACAHVPRTARPSAEAAPSASRGSRPPTRGARRRDDSTHVNEGPFGHFFQYHYFFLRRQKNLPTRHRASRYGTALSRYSW